MMQSKCATYFFIFAIFFSSFTVKSGQQKNAVELVPIEDLFNKPEKSHVQISSDGTIISYLAQHNGVKNIWVRVIGGEDRAITDQSSCDIKDYFCYFNNVTNFIHRSKNL